MKICYYFNNNLSSQISFFFLTTWEVIGDLVLPVFFMLLVGGMNSCILLPYYIWSLTLLLEELLLFSFYFDLFLTQKLVGNGYLGLDFLEIYSGSFFFSLYSNLLSSFFYPNNPDN